MSRLTTMMVPLPETMRVLSNLFPLGGHEVAELFC